MAKFTELANQLANNHLHLAFPTDFLPAAQKQILKNPKPVSTRAVVVVTGAGASHDANGLPLGKDIFKLLYERLQIPEKFINNELDRLTIQYRLERDEFETQLLALSKFSGNNLVDELASIFFRRFYASMVYELLAHLLKHRFIDAIINFNFDELLDQAIDDEVGIANYHRIVSDGGLSDDLHKLEDKNLRFKVPLYIKPHGTASHKSSLRFTREAYFLLHKNIRDLLTKLLSNTPTTLILMGFGMKSIEFTSIVEDAAQKNSLEIFFIDTDPGIGNRIPKDVEKVTHISTGRKGLGNILSELWDSIEDCFHNTSRPRGIARHRLISALFWEELEYKKDEGQRPWIEQYLKDRTILEIALVIAKTKGFVNVGQLSMSRVGHYFHEYRKYDEKTSETIYKLCQELGLSKVGYSYDTLRLSQNKSGRTGPNDELIIDPEAWPQHKKMLMEATIAQLSPLRQKLIQKPGNMRLFEKTLDYMYKYDEVEVLSPTESPYQLFFWDPIRLGSLESMKVFTKKMLNMEWDKLLCVAESGEWLLGEDFAKLITEYPGRSLKIIVADGVYVSDIEKRFEDLDTQILRMPWWFHNQHMTIIVRGKLPVCGVFFERRLRTLSITPIGINGQRDLDIALTAFLAYWVKSERFQKNPKSVFVSQDDVQKTRKKLLC